MKKKKKIIIAGLIFIAILVPILIVANMATKNWAFIERLTLASIIIPLVMGAFTVLNSIFSETPKFEVLNPRVKTEGVADRTSRVIIAKTEKPEVITKAIIIDVKNKNPDADLTNCKIRIETKSGKWDIENLDKLIPDDPKTICLFRIGTKESVVSPYKTKNKVKLDVGGLHDLDIRFIGEKFSNKKIWHMELDLTSWDNCGLRFKTRREVLKEKIGGQKDE
jgi:hypothetical protein